MVTRAWKVYGAEGHRQRESFGESCEFGSIVVENSDKTGTNEYSIIRITKNTPEECENELNAQISDGFFENSRVGNVVEIFDEEKENTTDGAAEDYESMSLS